MSLPGGHCRRCANEASRLIDGMCERCLARDDAPDEPQPRAGSTGLDGLDGLAAPDRRRGRRPGRRARAPTRAARAGARRSPGAPARSRPALYLDERSPRDQMDAVVEALELDGKVRAVASHMAKSANGLSKPHPGCSMYESNPTIARHTGFSVETVKRARRTLQTAGVIVKTRDRVLEGKKVPVFRVGWSDRLGDDLL